MYYLGQSVAYTKYVSSKKLAAIVTGFNDTEAPYITYINENGELQKHFGAFAVDIKLVRQPDKKSLTGHSIYKGKIYKHGYIGPVKIKLPSDEELIEELKACQKLIDK